MNLDDAIGLIKKRWPDVVSQAQDEPVFVLAAGWRSGSTLLQRMLLNNCLVWGEPFGSSGIIERLSQPLCRFAPDWPGDKFFIESAHWGPRPSERWTANLYPSVQDLQEAHVSFFRTLLAEPSRRRGCARWGLKEVRYGVEHAVYLRWLFPRARFLFLLRSPYECWSSYRRTGGRVLRFFPEPLITTPEQFGSHWLKLAEGFCNRHREVDGLLLRFETFTKPDFDVKPLEQYLGFGLNLVAREKRVGASPAGPLSEDEMERLHKVVEPLAKRLGYLKPVRGEP